jgi:hypothetical protein
LLEPCASVWIARMSFSMGVNVKWNGPMRRMLPPTATFCEPPLASIETAPMLMELLPLTIVW